MQEPRMPDIKARLDRVGLSDLLEALDGIAYVVDPDGLILATNRRQWQDTAVTGGAPELTPDAVRGRSLFAMIAGQEVQDVARRMHDAVLMRRHRVVSYAFRCDGPDVERRMRMSMAPLDQGDEPLGVLYHSIILSECVRAPMPLFEPAAMQAYFDRERTRAIVTLCSYCHAVAWPLDAPAKARDWIEPTDYYRRGGPSDARVSHGICPACYRTVVEDSIGRT